MSKELSPAEIGGLAEMVEREGLPEQSFHLEVVPEVELKEISRNSFLSEIDRQIDRWQEKYLEAKLRILELRETESKIRKAEFRGMRVYFFETEDAVFFQAEEKVQAGFIKDLSSRSNPRLEKFKEKVE